MDGSWICSQGRCTAAARAQPQPHATPPPPPTSSPAAAFVLSNAKDATRGDVVVVVVVAAYTAYNTNCGVEQHVVATMDAATDMGRHFGAGAAAGLLCSVFEEKSN